MGKLWVPEGLRGAGGGADGVSVVFVDCAWQHAVVCCVCCVAGARALECVLQHPVSLQNPCTCCVRLCAIACSPCEHRHTPWGCLWA